jgi:hypothetical protein
MQIMDKQLAVGDKMPDGTIFAGISPDTHQAMYAAPADTKLAMDFNEAAKYAADLNAYGHSDWRVPTQAELDVLFQNREKGALKGTFNAGADPTCYYKKKRGTPNGKFTTHANDAGVYWSSTPYRNNYTAAGRSGDSAIMQIFSDKDTESNGAKSAVWESNRLSVRLVRS